MSAEASDAEKTPAYTAEAPADGKNRLLSFNGHFKAVLKCSCKTW